MKAFPTAFIGAALALSLAACSSTTSNSNDSGAAGH
jgi:hypothetical protein